MLVPLKWAGQDKRFADGLKENLDIICGHRGDPLDRAITARDLLESGIAKLPAGSTIFGGSSRELIPPATIPYLIVPPAPTNLQASGAFQVILLGWDLPLYIGHAHVEIWRNATDSLATASMLATTTQAFGQYSDNVGSSSSFYYWVRAVNANGVSGPFNGSAGTLGETAPDIAFLLSTLSSAITSSQLATDLATPIATIPAISSNASAALALANNASAIAASASSAATSATNAVSALNTTVAALQNVSPWVAGASHALNDQVQYSGGLYSARSAHTASASNAPTVGSSNSTWLYLGNYTSLSSAVAGNTADILDVNTLSASSASAAARKIASLDLDVNHPTTGLNFKTQSVQALTNEVFPNGTTAQGAITALNAVVTHPTTGLSATAGIVSNLSQNIGYNGATQQSKVDSFEAILDDGAGNLLTTTALSTLINEVYPSGLTQQSAISLLGSTSSSGGSTLTQSAANALLATVFPSGITQQSSTAALQAILNDSSGTLVEGQAVSTLINEIYPNGTSSQSKTDLLQGVLEKPDGTLVSAGALNSLVNNVFPNGTSSSSLVTQLENVLRKPDNTLVSSGVLSALESEVFPNGVSGNSSIDTLQSGYVNPDGSTGTVSLQQAMSTQANINGDLTGQYSVKVDTNGHVAGFGLSSTLNNGIPSSAFIVDAEKFAIVHHSDTSAATNNPNAAHVPFAVVQATTLNGVAVPAGVYMKQAFILNGAITNAKIGDAAIGNAKISDLSATKIDTGTLDASKVTIAGVAPTLNIRSADVGARMQITANSIQIFDGAGIRVKLGQL